MHAKRLVKWVGLAALAAGALAVGACGRAASQKTAASAIHRHPAKKTLQAFGSEKELTKYLQGMVDKQRLERERQMAQMQQQPGYAPPSGAAPTTPAPAAEPSASTDKAEGESAGAADSDESVTNVQHAGVDEGGIVKLHGNHLVVLRRGRLFTIEVGNGELTPISSVDAFGPDVDPSGTWYDEMLLGSDTIAVIGYSYSRGGTEIGLFDISRSGRLSYRATYHLRSNDYYSSRNYASRLIGSKLVFYTPLYLSLDERDLFKSFPALRKWRRGAKESDFRRIASATRVYPPVDPATDFHTLGLHTVTVCDLAQRELDCDATVVMGPPGRVFYVSPGSVYVWTTDWRTEGGESRPRSVVYRMPLDGSGPSVLRAAGSPVDQFSFLESGDGHLNVLVRAEAAGDGMWSAEVAAGQIALMRVPIESFSDGDASAPRSAYELLEQPKGHTFQNRFVGDWVLYGTGSGWGSPEDERGGTLHAYRYAGGRKSKLALAHGVDRIEPLGSDAIVIGTDGKDLHFSPVRLGGRPALAPRYTRKNASQGELRSHGFFYKPTDDDSGLLGLPIAEAGRPGYEHLFQGSASVLFLRNDALRLSELGPLRARPERNGDDGCRASCVDWYGNARPLFLKGRVFALLGYEIVEGALDGGRSHERRRVSFAPTPTRIAR
jgi:hypothetical protein